jgi:hypothetical protein
MAPSSQRITVQPVKALKSLAWPTLIPGTSVMAFNLLIRGDSIKKEEGVSMISFLSV